MWNYQRDFITRALYSGETLYSVAESGIKSWNFDAPSSPKASLEFPKSTGKKIYPVPMMAK